MCATLWLGQSCPSRSVSVRADGSSARRGRYGSVGVRADGSSARRGRYGSVGVHADESTDRTARATG
ncbi:MAG: hypothetical protein NZ874_03540 [Fimbriimonadales bacterium]|nr:hypothetical protein [Fimbriimonadales bacterium]